MASAPEQQAQQAVPDGEFAFTWSDFRQIAALVHGEAGILMPDSKANLVYSRLSKRLRDIGLLDSRIGIALLLAAGNLPIAAWMLFSNFREVPGEILEAARMDGASLWQEVATVLAPLALPGIASTFFLIFTLAWNESFWSLNLVTTEATPLTAFIAAFSSPQGLFWARLSAASILSIAPVLLIGWLCQRQLVRGLTFGAVK